MSEPIVNHAIAGELASRFYGATLGRAGTNEQEVYAILGEVHRLGLKDAFNSRLEGMRFLKAIALNDGSLDLVPAILADEMSGTELSRARDIWRDGKPSHSDSTVDHLIQGMINGFGDVGELFYEHPVAATGTAVAVGGIMIAGAAFEVPAILIGSAVLAVGVGAFEAGSAVYHCIKATAAKDRSDEVRNIEEAGRRISGFAMAATAANAAGNAALRSAMGIGCAAKIHAAANAGKETPGALKGILSIAHKLFMPAGKTYKGVALDILAKVRAAPGKKAQGEALRSLLQIPEGLGKLSLDRVRQAALREIASDAAVHASVRREALIALDRAGALEIGTGGKDIAVISQALLGKTSGRGTIATDQDAAMLVRYAVQILSKSKDPRALDIMRATYWKNLHEVRKATGHKVSIPVLDDLAKAISAKDPAFPAR